MLDLLVRLVSTMAYISVPLYILQVLSNRSPTTRYYFRLFLYLSALSVCSVWGVIVSIALTIAGRRFDINYVVARSFYLLCSNVMGITIDTENMHLLEDGPAIMVGNHQTMMDILYLARIFPHKASIMAKKELQLAPFLGQYLTASGAVFLNRSSNKDAVSALAAAGQELKQRGISLWMFPEGTRHSARETGMLPFKKGAFHLAIQAQVPVIPVVCQNYWHLYHKGTFDSGKLKLAVLDPVPTTGLTAADVPDLITRVRDAMLAKLIEISDGTVPAKGQAPSATTTSVTTPLSPAIQRPPPSVSGSTADGSDDDAVLVDRP
ncbi:1-acylglycerol-3-phosphate O [Clavulina sp. PMI_390]|nr:1-acylglycerol-3-phosphate O [Clavulina sp. PMI_390]